MEFLFFSYWNFQSSVGAIVRNVIKEQGLWKPADLFRETSDPQYDFESVSFISAIQNIFPSPFWLWKPYCLHKSFPGFFAL